ncbi:glycosyltransferase family 2 protein [Paraburkholderia caballeronis]|uniref:glycosyltransferase family 2 protein n=1 Tax=Paraburkholderia caballeronis TaxID=416943 RepID=UPI001065774C|nr:glycosyltransferase family 2 protein [Paraburkholderia caballeronis]
MKVTNESESFSDARGLSISIVVFHPDVVLLERTLRTLCDACARMRALSPDVPVDVFIVDNGGLELGAGSIRQLAGHDIEYEVIAGHGNVGYGRGHNLAIARAASRLHLILNPDVELDPQALVAAAAFFDAHPEAGLLAPRIDEDSGELQYLCRRYPSLLDLLVRGFAPASLRRCMARRLAHYEMRDVIDGTSVVWDPPIVSGCFMLFRTALLKRLGGFDPRYFLYFEDYDLSVRAHELTRVAYVPAVRVVHHGGGASRKGMRHIRFFGVSAFRFFNRFGWRWW